MVGRTGLSDADYERCWEIVDAFLAINDTIRNSEFREITGGNYDQAIKFFNRCVEESKLERRGNRPAVERASKLASWAMLLGQLATLRHLPG